MDGYARGVTTMRWTISKVTKCSQGWQPGFHGGALWRMTLGTSCLPTALWKSVGTGGKREEKDEKCKNIVVPLKWELGGTSDQLLFIYY